jgi:hypothetical protein
LTLFTNNPTTTKEKEFEIEKKLKNDVEKTKYYKKSTPTKKVFSLLE